MLLLLVYFSASLYSSLLMFQVARDRATVNYAGSRSTDLDQDGLSHHMLLTRPSGGFRRMDSMQTVASWQGTGDIASTAESPHHGSLQRSQSERGYQPKAKGMHPLLQVIAWYRRPLVPPVAGHIFAKSLQLNRFVQICSCLGANSFVMQVPCPFQITSGRRAGRIWN